MKSSTLAIVVVVIVAIIGLGWWWYAKAPSTTGPAQTQTQTTGTDQGQPDTGVTAGVGASVGQPVSAFTVRYTSSGFSPSTMTVPVGTTVTFIDQTADPMWLASDPHPSHTAYDGTSRSTHCAAGYSGPAPFDECSAGTTFTFTFTKAGSFGYHNHLNDNDHGTIVVQ